MTAIFHGGTWDGETRIVSGQPTHLVPYVTPYGTPALDFDQSRDPAPMHVQIYKLVEPGVYKLDRVEARR